MTSESEDGTSITAKISPVFKTPVQICYVEDIIIIEQSVLHEKWKSNELFLMPLSLLLRQVMEKAGNFSNFESSTLSSTRSSTF